MLATAGRAVRAGGPPLSRSHCGQPGADASRSASWKRFLYDRVYRHPRLIAVRSAGAGAAEADVRAAICARPELLAAAFSGAGRAVGLPRAVGDYLAGMTDRFCDQQYRAALSR